MREWLTLSIEIYQADPNLNDILPRNTKGLILEMLSFFSLQQNKSSPYDFIASILLPYDTLVWGAEAILNWYSQIILSGITADVSIFSE